MTIRDWLADYHRRLNECEAASECVNGHGPGHCPHRPDGGAE